LRELLQSIVHPPEIHSESVFALVEIGHAQDLVALQCAIGPHLDCVECVIGIFEKQPAGTFARSEVNPDHQSGCKHDFRNENEDPAVALFDSATGPHLYVEQMLSTPLPQV
jgi:hypothetical protein